MFLQESNLCSKLLYIFKLSTDIEKELMYVDHSKIILGLHCHAILTQQNITPKPFSGLSQEIVIDKDRLQQQQQQQN